MPRKPDRQPGKQSHIHSKRQELDQREAQIKAQLNETRAFLQKAPDLKVEVQRREQRAIFDRYTRPSRIEGPADFRLELVGGKSVSKPPRLRKERSKAALLTVLLLVAFGVVVYHAWRVLWQG